ncbi:unnamed protein product [Callosobruchus maculatus]|uniref:Secreted protein n=1 Tax=Callosobruchus maculatus TaxID=64391 RepID=A0A653D5R0_CALMS|nr:unnamed protein product [Callosobruchus maculatus]
MMLSRRPLFLHTRLVICWTYVVPNAVDQLIIIGTKSSTRLGDKLLSGIKQPLPQSRKFSWRNTHLTYGLTSKTRSS